MGLEKIHMMTLDDWITPDWPTAPNVRAVFTTRSGGVSATPFDSFNLGDHVHDDAVHVATNRAKLATSLGAKPIFMQQVHGTRVLKLDAHTTDALIADACITQEHGVACTAMVADCLPLLWTNRAGTVVAASHAGWRGLLGQGGEGVIEATFKSLCDVVHVNTAQAAINLIADDLLVWLGPCIGAAQFEVGAEVCEAFVGSHPEAAQHFAPLPNVATQAPKYLCNLSALARQRLHALGISQIYGNDGSQTWCTVSQPSRFFSHRRDSARLGGSGRMAACIWLVD
jgi:polyphenol oxidase